MGHSPVLPYGYGNVARWLYTGVVAVSIPFLFKLTSRNRLDDAIGQYSYPVYMSHFIFIIWFSEFMHASPLGYGITVAGASLIFSFVLIRSTNFIEAWRRDIARKANG